MKKSKTVHITFTLDEDIVEWLSKQAQETDTSKSWVTRKVFREAMKSNKQVKVGK